VLAAGSPSEACPQSRARFPASQYPVEPAFSPTDTTFPLLFCPSSPVLSSRTTTTQHLSSTKDGQEEPFPQQARGKTSSTLPALLDDSTSTRRTGTRGQEPRVQQHHFRSSSHQHGHSHSQRWRLDTVYFVALVDIDSRTAVFQVSSLHFPFADSWSLANPISTRLGVGNLTWLPGSRECPRNRADCSRQPTSRYLSIGRGNFESKAKNLIGLVKSN